MAPQGGGIVIPTQPCQQKPGRAHTQSTHTLMAKHEKYQAAVEQQELVHNEHFYCEKSQPPHRKNRPGGVGVGDRHTPDRRRTVTGRTHAAL